MKKTGMITLALAAPFCVFAETAFFNEYTRESFYFMAVALAAWAGTRGQSLAASAALEGIARNPSAADRLLVPMILGLALMESLVIFTLATIFLT